MQLRDGLIYLVLFLAILKSMFTKAGAPVGCNIRRFVSWKNSTFCIELRNGLD